MPRWNLAGLAPVPTLSLAGLVLAVVGVAQVLSAPLGRPAHQSALVAERGQAEAVVEVRAGALSIDESETLFGIPSYEVPIPLASGLLKLPEVALYKRKVRKGVAKIAATSYGTADGRLIDSAEQIGYSHKKEYRVLLFFSWRTSDLPKEEGDSPLGDW